MPPTPEIQYERLTRFSVAFRTRGSLWLGTDHLLCVLGNGYLESYKRFYFRDIQAIIIRRTNRRMIWNFVLATTLTLCLIIALALASGHADDAFIVSMLIPTPFLLALLVANHLFGPGCVCYLRTAVQIEQLPSLYRLGKARRVLAQIRPLIAAAQGGELSAETITARMRESIETSTGAPAAAPATQETDVPPRLQS